MSGQDFPLNIFEEFSPSFLHKEKIVRLVIWLRINTQRTDGAACEEKQYPGKLVYMRHWGNECK
jgi:hypothetical protein